MSIFYRFFILLYFVSSLTASLLAQEEDVEEISLKNIQGQSVGSESESISVIRERAINEAKVEALNRAGVSESIKAFSDFYESQTDGNYEELFTSDIFSDMQGAVRNVNVVRENKEFTDDGLPRVTVEINCTVLKYNTDRDRTFEFEVDGLSPVYEDGDLLTYSFKPHKKGYLRVFVFTSEDAYQVFPNEYERSVLLNPEKQKSYKFPQHVDIILESEEDSETHRMVFVFLKEDIPYTGEVSYKDIFDWIFSIAMDQRKIKTFSFVVTNGES